LALAALPYRRAHTCVSLRPQPPPCPSCIPSVSTSLIWT